ncbi:hypothetical protein KAR91_20070 [Candidatus Pacearchaeota archaeon]|nr:hypothetical protein [Candidatus Pacearchaeota archaeon]
MTKLEKYDGNISNPPRGLSLWVQSDDVVRPTFDDLPISHYWDIITSAEKSWVVRRDTPATAWLHRYCEIHPEKSFWENLEDLADVHSPLRCRHPGISWHQISDLELGIGVIQCG